MNMACIDELYRLVWVVRKGYIFTDILGVICAQLVHWCLVGRYA